MTVNEAKTVLECCAADILDRNASSWENELVKRTYEALDVAIESLEKQMPKKPIIKTNLMTKHVSAHCSICDTDITYYSSEEKYCHNCGKSLKWE